VAEMGFSLGGEVAFLALGCGREGEGAGGCAHGRTDRAIGAGQWGRAGGPLSRSFPAARRH
jgi:hypothetical protein